MGTAGCIYTMFSVLRVKSMEHRTMKKILMLPWLAHGHISPFLELARTLSDRNFTVYLCSTPVNLASIPEEYSSSIHLVEIHLTDLPNLPPRYHTTRGLPPHLMNTLKRVFDESVPDQISNAVDRISPDLLIYDFLSPWSTGIARSRGIPAVLLVNVAAGVACFMLHTFKNRGEKFPSEAIYLPEYFLAKMAEQIPEEDGSESESVHKDAERALQSFRESRDVILMRSFGELESKYLDYLSDLTGKKVLPLGPLVPDLISGEDEKGLIRWLDEKEKSSTVFLSFGTEYFLSAEERQEIAYGLEIAGVNFIWVIRFPEGEETRLEETLPNGFLDRIQNKGVVVEHWAPQTRILAHPSVGGFVSHCGWNSVMESLKFGVPIVGMPMHLDQPLNARVIDEAGVGVEVRRGTGGRLDRDEIARVVRDVVLEEKGESVRKKVKEISEGIMNRGDAEINDVISGLIELCDTN